MKKLNITKKQYDESQYFTTKYGKLTHVAESGKMYKTDKGVVLQLESEDSGDDAPEVDVDDEPKAEPTDGEVTKAELTEMLTDVVGEIKDACDANGIPFEEVAGTSDEGGDEPADDGEVEVESAKKEDDGKEKAKADEEGDEDEPKEVSAEEEPAADEPVSNPGEILAGIIDCVKDIAADKGIEVPGEEDGGEEEDEIADLGDEDEPEDEFGFIDEEEEEDGKRCHCRGGKCHCGKKVEKECGDATFRESRARRIARLRKILESRRLARKAKMVRESIVRRHKARKTLSESIRRSEKNKTILSESRKARIRSAVKRYLESKERKARIRKMMESRRTRVMRRRPRAR